MAQGLSVAAAVVKWLEFYVPTARSAKNVGMAAQRAREYLVPQLGEKLLADVRPDDLRGYRLALEARGLAPRTVRHLLADARCLLNWAVDSDLISRSPFPRRIMPRIQESAPDRLWDPEVDAVMGIGEPHAFYVRLGLATGLRWAEMCRAQASDLQGGMLVVERTKSSKLRRVPLPPPIAREVRMRVGRLVPYTEGAASSFNRMVQRRSGVATFHVHQLRHTFACKWIEGGGTLPSLQQILGHASVVSTQIYARLSDESIRREAERIHETMAALRPQPV